MHPRKENPAYTMKRVSIKRDHVLENLMRTRKRTVEPEGWEKVSKNNNAVERLE